MSKELPIRKLLTDREAAAYIGFSMVYLRKSRCEGNRKGGTPAPPYIKIGRSVRYSIDDLDQWIKEHRREVL